MTLGKTRVFIFDIGPSERWLVTLTPAQYCILVCLLSRAYEKKPFAILRCYSNWCVEMEAEGAIEALVVFVLRGAKRAGL